MGNNNGLQTDSQCLRSPLLVELPKSNVPVTEAALAKIMRTVTSLQHPRVVTVSGCIGNEQEEALMAMTYAQLIAGVAVGLFVWSLMVSTPLWRDLLAAVAAAGIADLLVGKHSPPDAGSIIDRIAA